MKIKKPFQKNALSVKKNLKKPDLRFYEKPKNVVIFYLLFSTSGTRKWFISPETIRAVAMFNQTFGVKSTVKNILRNKKLCSMYTTYTIILSNIVMICIIIHT